MPKNYAGRVKVEFADKKTLGEGSICELISICRQGSDYYKPGLEAASTGTVNICQAFTVM